MLLAAACDHRIVLSESYLIGDRWRDINAGRAAGCCTILISPDAQARGEDFQPNLVATSLGEAVDFIVSSDYRLNFPGRSA
jgi:D-glycero-D-manno-heptose 1,7-bisphosphate phosphatase